MINHQRAMQLSMLIGKQLESRHMLRSAWGRGVRDYVVDLFVDSLEYLSEFETASVELIERRLLNGADSWKAYSYGGCSLIYDQDIAERLATPSELARTNGGLKQPNRYETWLDVQARALMQAAAIVSDAAMRYALDARGLR